MVDLPFVATFKIDFFTTKLESQHKPTYTYPT